MASQIHSRNVSEETNASVSSQQHALEHLLQYPGSYEIPLRTMYTINCAQRARPVARSRAPTPTSNSASPTSPTSGKFTWADSESTSNGFTATLMNQIAQLPSQPCSLPPTFIVSFLSKCFPPCLQEVDFAQALAALDYLRDLETRRRKEFSAAFRRLSVLPNTVGTEADDFSERYPGVGAWVRKAEAKNKKADAYYCQVWVSLRRWVMINEMSSMPFSKHNCVAMLNTLYPPTPPGVNTQPIKDLTIDKYKAQCDGFFKYITHVGKRGPGVLKNLMEQGMLEGDENGWGACHLALDKYLGTAKQMIDDCIGITSADHLDTELDAPNRKGKKTDSGVSFGSSRRPSTSNGKELSPPMPSPPLPHKSAQKGLSTLEKISREFKRMRVKARPDVEEIAKPEKSSTPVNTTEIDNKKSKPRLKKIKSLGSLQGLKTGNMSSTSLVGRRKPSDAEDFDADEMKRQRMKYDAKYDTVKSKKGKNSKI